MQTSQFWSNLAFAICNFVFKINSKLENSNVLIVISLHGVCFENCLVWLSTLVESEVRTVRKVKCKQSV